MTLGPLCSGCPLQKKGTGYAVSRGSAKHGVVIVGEALGEEEVLQKKPFVGKSGQLLDRIISRTKDPLTKENLRPEDFLITNVLRCRPPGNELTGTSYENEAIQNCSPYLNELLKLTQPKAILTLGNQALRWFVKEWGIEKLRGYVWPTDFGPLVGTYHPAYLLKGNLGLVRIVQMDILKALYLARHGTPTFEKNYILRPSLFDVVKFNAEYDQAFKADPSTILSFDIETPYSSALKDDVVDPELEDFSIEDDASYQILRISFSFRPGHGITMVWEPPYTKLIKMILEQDRPSMGWNSLHFDIPRIEANGVQVLGRHYDGMDLFHFLEPGFPMGLKSAATYFCPDMPPWKLIANEQPEWYSVADSDVALRCFLRMREQAQSEGRWEIFERHFVDLSQVLKKMSQRGVRVSRELRKKASLDFEARFKTTCSELQTLIPMELKPKKVYKLKEETLKKKLPEFENLVKSGQMIEITTMEPVKHKHDWTCHRVNDMLSPATLVSCLCLAVKPRPKTFKCNCGLCPRKERKPRKSAKKPL